MLIFIPLLFAYATFWSSILVFKVPIPTPSPTHPTLPYVPFPLLSIVSVVEDINTLINSFPTAQNLIYPATWTEPPAQYIDASPVSPNPPPLNLFTCVPLDWPPLSDFGYLGTRTCSRVARTDLVIWNGPFDPPDLFSRFASTVGDYTHEDTRFFVSLVAFGVGFWLTCRLVAVAVSRRSNSTATEARDHQCHLPGILVVGNATNVIVTAYVIFSLPIASF